MHDCYLDGQFLPIEQARVSVLDRGFLFGDGVYEVIPVYGGRPFRLQEHMRRLQASLDAIRLTNPLDESEWKKVVDRLISSHGGGELSLYLQITRGAAPGRDHAFPANVVPTRFVMVSPLVAPSVELQQQGVEVVLLEDNRWLRCNVKSISLLANLLLRQQAIDQGATEALLVRDGWVTEGAATNFVIVENGKLVTPPKDHRLLPGITRDLVLELALANGFAVAEEPVSRERLIAADELWITSSTKEILPVTRLDGAPFAGGLPGDCYRQMIGHYQAYKRKLQQGLVNE
jgi:D-alanine transaminase